MKPSSSVDVHTHRIWPSLILITECQAGVRWMSVLVETSLGDIVIDLYYELCPIACTNFLKLCKTKYYNFCVFHKIEKNFIAQTGDPTFGQGGDSIFRYFSLN